MLRIKVLSGTAVKCLSHRRALLFAGPLGCQPGNIHGNGHSPASVTKLACIIPWTQHGQVTNFCRKLLLTPTC